MLLFISFDKPNADLAAELQAALRGHNIETRSSLDVPSEEDWRRLLDEEGAKADGFIFLFGPDISITPELQTEWRLFLRNDWEGTKSLIPIVHAEGTFAKLPGFLRIRKAIFTTDFDSIVDRVKYLVEHPKETVDPVYFRLAEIEHEKHVNAVRAYALALKREAREAKQR